MRNVLIRERRECLLNRVYISQVHQMHQKQKDNLQKKKQVMFIFTRSPDIYK